MIQNTRISADLGHQWVFIQIDQRRMSLGGMYSYNLSLAMYPFPMPYIFIDRYAQLL